MKKRILFILLLITSINYSQWEWQYPKPQGNDLNSVHFVNENVGFAVGLFGTIIKTTDAGENWSLLKTSVYNHLTSVDFVNTNVGYVVGSEGIILKTTDGGTTWKKLTSTTDKNLYSVSFVDENLGFAVGDNATILKTSNGGNTWIKQISYTTNNLSKVKFINSTTGYIIGEKGTILKTVTSGLVWLTVNITTTHDITAFSLINDNKIFIGDKWGFIYKTTNGGNSWDLVKPGNYNNDEIISLNFLDEQVGIYINYLGIYKTLNGGLNWNKIFDISIILRQLFFVNKTIGFVVGNNGFVYKTTNGGNSWINKISYDVNSLNKIKFISSNIGFAIGNNNKFLKTTDGGKNWILSNISSTTITDLEAIEFFNASTGFVCGYTLFKTINGGNSWVEINGIDNYHTRYSSICSIEKGVSLCMVGGSGTILKSTTAGSTWKKINSGVTENLKSVFFPTKNIGFAVGDNGVILKTNDEGNNWINTHIFPKNNLLEVFFIDEFTGWCVGENNTIYKTTNSGNSWMLKNSGLASSVFHIKTVFFINKDEGWISGTIYSNDPIFYKTTNGGESWIPIYFSPSGINSIYFLNDKFGYVVTTKGSILYTSNGGEIPTAIENKNDIELPKDFVLYQNYPNPFNPTTTIKYSIPNVIANEVKQSKNEIASSQQNGTRNDAVNVTLKVYDILGKEVATLVNERQSAGNYEVKFDGSKLSSGVYFYRLQSGNPDMSGQVFVQTRKFILMK